MSPDAGEHGREQLSINRRVGTNSSMDRWERDDDDDDDSVDSSPSMKNGELMITDVN